MSLQQFIQDVCDSRLEPTVHLPEIRQKLYSKSAQIFRTMHQKSEDPDLTIKKYCTALKEQIEDVEKYYGPAAAKEREIYQELLATLSLCDILYFSTSNANDIQQALVDWYKEANKPYLFEYSKQSIYHNEKSAFQSDDFWPYAIRLAVLGQIEQLSALFFHIRLEISLSSQFKQIERIVFEFGAITQNGIVELRKKKTDIRRSIDLLQEIQHSDSNLKHHIDQLVIVMSILLGDEPTTLKHTKDNIIAFISCLFYNDTTSRNNVPALAKKFHQKYTLYKKWPQWPFISGNMVNQDNLLDLAKKFRQECKSDKQSSQWLFISGDIYGGLESSSHYDWWFLTHLTDLLIAKDMLEQPITIPGEEVISLKANEYFVLYYASFLNNQFGWWEEAFAYLVTCGKLGRDAIIQHLSNIDLNKDDLNLTQIVQFCIDFSMKNNGLELYEKKASIYLVQKDYKKALQYYSHAEKQKCSDDIFQAALEDFIMNGQLVEIDWPEDYNGIYFTIYQDLFRINSLYMDGNFEEATKVYNSLVKRDLIPNSIMPIVFSEGLKLIEGENMYFKEQDLLELKKIWTTLKRSVESADFKLYHCYIQNLEVSAPTELKDIKTLSLETLSDDMNEFFEATAVIVSRTLNRLKKQ